MMLRLILTVGMALGLGFFWGCTASTTERDVERNTMTVAGLRKLLDQADRKNKDTLVVLIDPRPQREFEQGHIKGARNLTLAALGNGNNKDLTRFKNIVVYGTDPSNAPARAMTKRLIASGYSDVALLEGGLLQWQAQGGEVVASPAARANASESP